MRAEVAVAASTLAGFLAVLVRVGSAFVFVPLPGLRQGPGPARVVLALAATVLLYPVWPPVPDGVGLGQMAGWLIAEAAFGTLAGALTGFIVEAFMLAAQAVGLQAGFAYASMVDPQTQADSGVLLVLAQLAGGLLFFSLGLEAAVVRVFARSLETLPPGSLVAAGPAVDAILRLGAGVFSTGLRLALPVVALLALVDIALALVGRINAQLQLLSMAFPLKMLAAMLMLAWLAPLFPRVLGAYGGQVTAAIGALAGMR